MNKSHKQPDLYIFLCQIKQISVIFSHLKLWVAVVGENVIYLIEQDKLIRVQCYILLGYVKWIRDKCRCF